jgi:hypothetical protein
MLGLFGKALGYLLDVLVEVALGFSVLRAHPIDVPVGPGEVSLAIGEPALVEVVQTDGGKEKTRGGGE